jgi:hypothetical protein
MGGTVRGVVFLQSCELVKGQGCDVHFFGKKHWNDRPQFFHAPDVRSPGEGVQNFADLILFLDVHRLGQSEQGGGHEKNFLILELNLVSANKRREFGKIHDHRVNEIPA